MDRLTAIGCLARRGRPGRLAAAEAAGSPYLPAWRQLLAVVAHPDDETFGLGGIIGRLTAAGSSVHILCYTHGDASTLNENLSDLFSQREDELRKASAASGRRRSPCWTIPTQTWRHGRQASWRRTLRR